MENILSRLKGKKWAISCIINIIEWNKDLPLVNLIEDLELKQSEIYTELESCEDNTLNEKDFIEGWNNIFDVLIETLKK